jgi:membrane-associated phospholipid phosphatase
VASEILLATFTPCLMTSPLDQQEHNRTGLVKAGRLFSNLVSPPVIFALVGLALSLKVLPLPAALAWAAVYGFVVSLLPIVFVLWLLRTGRIRELHMSNTGERHLPYLIAVACGVIVFGLVRLFEGPQLLSCLALFNIVTLTALGLINTRWLISFHATAIAAAWMIIGLVYGWIASIFVLPFLFGVVFVRLYLKRHTIAQVIAGLALGIGAVWSLTFFGCFG